MHHGIFQSKVMVALKGLPIPMLQHKADNLPKVRGPKGFLQITLAGTFYLARIRSSADEEDLVSLTNVHQANRAGILSGIRLA